MEGGEGVVFTEDESFHQIQSRLGTIIHFGPQPPKYEDFKANINDDHRLE